MPEPPIVVEPTFVIDFDQRPGSTHVFGPISGYQLEPRGRTSIWLEETLVDVSSALAT